MCDSLGSGANAPVAQAIAVISQLLFGPGGWLFGDGINAAADCTGVACNGGNGGLLWGNGGKGRSGGEGSTGADGENPVPDGPAGASEQNGTDIGYINNDDRTRSWLMPATRALMAPRTKRDGGNGGNGTNGIGGGIGGVGGTAGSGGPGGLGGNGGSGGLLGKTDQAGTAGLRGDAGLTGTRGNDGKRGSDGASSR